MIIKYVFIMSLMLLLTSCAGNIEKNSISEAQNLLFDMKNEKQDYVGLVELYESSLQREDIDWKKENYITFIHAYYQLSKYNKVISIYDNVYYQYEFNNVVSSMVGRSLYYAGEYDRSISTLSQVIESTPEHESNRDDYFFLSEAYIKNNDYYNAKIYLKKYILFDDIKKEKRMIARNNLAWMLYLTGSINESLIQYESLSSDYPDVNKFSKTYSFIVENYHKADSVGKFYIQLSSHQKFSDAYSKLLKSLNSKSKGHNIIIKPVLIGNEYWFRLVVTNFSSYFLAEKHAAEYYSEDMVLIKESL
ncbi:tetratricopeptide repeat protein [Vibrio paucivorans]